MDEHRPKKLLPSWERFLLILALIILLIFVLDRIGLKMTSRSDDTEIIDRPHQVE